MQANAQPSPCLAGGSYRITVVGGDPPYYFSLIASPPNPPGLGLSVQNGVATVTVPADTPQGAPIVVAVSDSSAPPQNASSTNAVM